MPRKKRQDPPLVSRHIVGLRIGGGPFSASGPMASLVYEDLFLDGTSRITRGHTVFGSQLTLSSNDRGEMLAQRPDMNRIFHAAAMLFSEIQDACMQLDKHRKIGELDPWDFVNSGDNRNLSPERAFEEKYGKEGTGNSVVCSDLEGEGVHQGKRPPKRRRTRRCAEQGRA